MNSRGRGSDGQDDVDAAFAEIVADLEREGMGSDIGAVTDKPTPTAGPGLSMETGRGGVPDPGGDAKPGPSAEPGQSGRRAEPGRAGEPAEHDQPKKSNDVWRGMESEWDWAAVVSGSDSEHYVPPEPPPLPKLKAGTIAALVMLVLGVLLLVAPALFGLPVRISMPIALVSLAAGIGLLVLRMRSGPPPDTGWDDGAQV